MKTMFRHPMSFTTYRGEDFADCRLHLVLRWSTVHVGGDHVRHWLHMSTQSLSLATQSCTSVRA